ncbi:MAG: 2-oxoglutarate dehydrogenase, E2 component, dihydrolipoamide succinyltransferase [Mycobacterium leprae]
MPVSVTMPRLGESVSEGTVTRWLKKEGDRVEADEPLLEVSTDKVDTEIPSPASGVVSAIRVHEDETVEVGSELAVIEGGQAAAPAAAEQAAPAEQTAPAEHAAPSEQAGQVEEAPPAEQAPAEAEPAEAGPAAQEADTGVARYGSAPPVPAPVPQPVQSPPIAPPPPAPPPPARTPPQPAAERPAEAEPAPAAAEGDGQAAYVTPLVRKLAAEHGVDLSGVRGTGVGGRIRKQDVLDAAKSQPPAPAAPAAPRPPAAAAAAQVRGRTEKMSRLRQVIATRMVESLHTSAQLTTVAEADVTRVARLRDAARATFEAREGVRLSFLPFFALATCEALKLHPNVNASIDMDRGEITYHDAEHLGIAVDTPRGLLVPVIHDAGDLNLAGLARKIVDLAERTRSNQITPDELGGGTFTLTNTGSRGALFDTPIINQPQVGILGTGSVVKRPAVVDDPDLGEVIAIRSIVYLALTYDHRVVDGADAARFLMTVKNRLEEGRFEAELGL